MVGAGGLGQGEGATVTFVEAPCGGIPLAVATLRSVQSVCVGLWFRSGSRYEGAGENGAAHFVEHLLFKGTQRRSAKRISQEIEGVGGYLNAFTAEEMTCYYASATVRHLPLLLDVLLDMVTGSTFVEREVERERNVILEEIKMYEDQPSQVAQDRLNQLLWRNHALGRPITGTAESVQGLSREALLRFRERWFDASRLSVVIAGNVTWGDAAKLLQPLLSLAGGSRPVGCAGSGFARSRKPSPLRQPLCEELEREIEQTQVALGLRAVSRHDPRRFALKLASVVLGENMSSRLFQEIREKRGLAYSIGSHVAYFEDCGALFVSAGAERAHAGEILDRTFDQLNRLSTRGVTAAELRRAKDYVTGQMWLGLESTSNVMMWMGEALLGYGKIAPPEEIERRVQEVAASDVKAIAHELLHGEPACTTLVLSAAS